MLIAEREFFLSLRSQIPGNFVPTNRPERQKKFWMNCVIPYRGSFSMGTERIDKQSGKAFGAVTRIRPK